MVKVAARARFYKLHPCSDVATLKIELYKGSDFFDTYLPIELWFIDFC